MSYKSPIDIVQEEMRTIFDNEVLKSVINVGIKVNKDVLIKALKYDRNQYLQGYEEAKEIYEKALDKSCEELAYKDNCLIMSIEEWKEWCLKD